MVQKETAEFKKRLLAMYKQHLELISLMPEPEDEKVVSGNSETEAEEIKSKPEEDIQSEEEENKFFDEVSMAETRRIELDVQE